MNFVELLAPARDLQSAVAAVDYGADAVYIGGAKFGARHAAGNSAEQIARVAEYAHRYGVRVHATLNTLIYDDELETAERQARELIAAGVDALIVQDMALRRMDLPVELHASTQVCNMTPEQQPDMIPLDISPICYGCQYLTKNHNRNTKRKEHC